MSCSSWNSCDEGWVCARLYEDAWKDVGKYCVPSYWCQSKRVSEDGLFWSDCASVVCRGAGTNEIQRDFCEKCLEITGDIGCRDLLSIEENE